MDSELSAVPHPSPQGVPLAHSGTRPPTLLVVTAHSGDFVWRTGGALAAATAAGGQAHVIALSYGERGESGELWRETGQTLEAVKSRRAEEARQAAAALGASFECFDLGDYPLGTTPQTVPALVQRMLDIAPDVLITHTPLDPFNPDHPEAHQVAVRARQLASGSNVPSAFPTIAPPVLLYCEPHQPELCGFVPTLYLDITAVIEAKETAMRAVLSQSYMPEQYRQRALYRANQARRVSGRASVRQAEAYQAPLPTVVSLLTGNEPV